MWGDLSAVGLAVEWAVWVTQPKDQQSGVELPFSGRGGAGGVSLKGLQRAVVTGDVPLSPLSPGLTRSAAHLT